VKALLLLAGRSRRFWPLAEKTLFPLCGKTLLEHQVERLKQGGCNEIILVGGEHNLEEAQSLFPDFETIEQENLDLGMRGAVLSALPKVGSDPVMIVSGNDVIASSGYEQLIKTAQQSGTDGAILAQKVERYFPGGYLEVEGERITSIVEKPGKGKEPSDLINIVAHIHNHPAALLEALQNIDESTDDGYEQALAKLFKDHVYRAAVYEGAWQPVKYPWHLLSLLTTFLDGIKEQNIDPSASIHPSAVIEGNVIIEEEVTILPHATIVGPCFVGKRSTVASNALVRQSSIGEQCVVGYSTEVKGSVLHSNVWTHMTYLGDSVIGNNVSFGAGSITGNFRLDEADISSTVSGERIDTGLVKFGTIIGNDCRLGIHTGINPGIKIGSGSFVSSQTLVSEDIPEKSFACMKEGKMSRKDNKISPPSPEERDRFRPR